jgi:hypothetical protein
MGVQYLVSWLRVEIRITSIDKGYRMDFFLHLSPNRFLRPESKTRDQFTGRKNKIQYPPESTFHTIYDLQCTRRKAGPWRTNDKAQKHEKQIGSFISFFPYKSTSWLRFILALF